MYDDSRNKAQENEDDEDLESAVRWTCKQCYHEVSTEADFAVHLRSHFKGHRARATRKKDKPNINGLETDNTYKTNHEKTQAFLKFDSLSTSQLEITQPNAISDLIPADMSTNENICEQLVDPSLVMPSKSLLENQFDYTQLLNTHHFPTCIGNGDGDNCMMTVDQQHCGKIDEETELNLQILTEDIILRDGMTETKEGFESEIPAQPYQLYYISDKDLVKSDITNNELPHLQLENSNDFSNAPKDVPMVKGVVDNVVNLIDLNGKVVSSLPSDHPKVLVEDKTSDAAKNSPYDCEICHKSFTTSAYLYRHLRKHTGEFKCKYCSVAFARKETCLTHRCPKKAMKEQDIVAQTPPSIISKEAESVLDTLVKEQVPEKPSKPKPWRGNPVTCGVCGVLLSDQSCLNRHMVRHNRAACYVCMYCPASVQYRHSMRRHLRLHHPEYIDEWNNKVFISSLQTENKVPGTHPRKATSSKKLKNSEAFKVPTHRPKKDSVLGMAMGDDTRMDLECNLLEKNGFSDSQNIEFVSNNRIIGNKEDSMDLISGFSNFDEDIGFQFLSLPDTFCKSLSGEKIKFDSKETSPTKSCSAANSENKNDSVNFNKTDLKLNSTKPKSKDFIFKSPVASKDAGDSIFIESPRKNSQLLSEFLNCKEVLALPRALELNDMPTPVMLSMPVILCDDEDMQSFSNKDRINTEVEILLCQPPTLDYTTSVLLAEEPTPSCAGGALAESSMQLVDTSNDFTFFVLG